MGQTEKKLKEMRNYIDRTGAPRNGRYEETIEELNAAQELAGDDLLHALGIYYSLGKARGYRQRKAEEKGRSRRAGVPEKGE
ncbi:MAG: hypothetical protein Q4C60_02035 [Eubacteriales bacterium]|nr:hypothetical protein [Eubacteriales bacterium]